MVQFGLNMNFLGIIQILVIIFILKIHYHIYLSNFYVLWTARQLNQSSRVPTQEFPRHRSNPALDRRLIH
jgi:hypothetical protein